MMGYFKFIFKQIICSKNIIKISPFNKPNYVFYATHTPIRGKKKFPSSIKNAFLAVCCIGMGGGIYGYFNAMPVRKRQLTAADAGDTGGTDYTAVIKNLPAVEPSRKINGPAKDVGLNLTLFQYQTCPFCCKVRAFLDYYGIPYDIIEVNPVMRQQIKFSKYRKVPILIAEEAGSNVKHQLNDSTVIISTLGTFLSNSKDGLQSAIKYYPPVAFTNDDGKKVTEFLNRYFLMFGEKQLDENAIKQIEKERKWREWADKEFVHTLSPNVYRTREEALQAFNYFSVAGEWEKNFSHLERLFVIYTGATVMYFIGKRLKKKHSLKDDVRQSLYDACNTWMKQISPKGTFFGGKVPNLADLAIYGHLSSIEGCSAFQDILHNTNIGSWYFGVKEAVTNHEGYKRLKLNEL